MLGRVSSTVYQASMGLAVLAPLTSGLLVEHFSGQWAMAAFAVAVGISLIISLALPGLKDMTSVAASEGTGPEPRLG
jgi:hypothetical protein